MNMIKYLDRLCRNIIAGKFNEKGYRRRKRYYGVEISTEPIFCSYGTIGFTVTVYCGSCYDIKYDGELNSLTIDDVFWKDYLNIMFLSENDVRAEGDMPVHKSLPRSVEFYCFTDAGEDMCFVLDEPTKHYMQEYIDGFDINENVLFWWNEGTPAGRKVPFDNIKEHYEDYEAYLKRLQEVCNKMPY